jgi:putative exosortase-associated protein (TIGR04073 family)
VRHSTLAGSLLILLLIPGAASAQTWERKLARGLSGMVAGVLELPGNMVAETQVRGPGEGLPFGFAKGLGMIVGDYFVEDAAPDPAQPLLGDD